MINIRLVCVGNLKEKYWLDACNEYAKRLQKFCKLTIIELAEQNKYQEKPRILQSEGEEILSNLAGKKILLDIKGKELTSEEFAKRIELLSQASSTLTFIIGGSYGVSEDVKQKVDEKISLGKITLPHNLARVVLLEQIYRGFMINSGSKYHK